CLHHSFFEGATSEEVFVMNANIKVLIACLALLALALPIYAHHPFAAEFDKDKPVTITGTVTKVDWANPHTHIFIDEKGDTPENWDVELGSPSKLRRIGWKKNSIKMGDQVTITGWRARDGSNHASANMVPPPTGERIADGSSYFEHT